MFPHRVISPALKMTLTLANEQKLNRVVRLPLEQYESQSSPISEFDRQRLVKINSL
jgi:hypothetical protein